MKLYDPGKVNVILGIPIGILANETPSEFASVQGFARGSFVRVERFNPSYSRWAGINGEIARTKILDKGGFIEFTLIQSSQTNLALSAVSATDELSGAGIFPAAVQDGNGNDIHFALEAWVERPSPAIFSDRSDTRVWRLICVDLTMASTGLENI